MKKIFYFICVCLFTLKSADICTDFVSFYEKYFNQILKYEEFSKAEKRFAFIFYYFESRNIADLRLEKNNFIDRVKDRGLSEAEINQIKDFFIKTTDQLSFFDQYQAKSLGWGNEAKLNIGDLIYTSFESVRSDLVELPDIKNMHETMADMTFVVKSYYDHETIFKDSFSDAHSSPEYFGKGFKKIDRNSNENKDKSLEEQYKAYSKSMNTAVSFFGGDLDDRDMLNFLDPDINYDQKTMRYDSGHYYQRINFLRYNFFKDFHNTVYAAWQLYCLYHNQSDLITRWQVFGNHETLTINRDQDKKNTCSSFVSMMSNIRQFILPTEIDFINKDKKEIISLSHAFGARRGLVETHENKLLHDNFRVMYLKSKPEYKEENLTIQGAYGNHVGFVKAFTKQSFQKNSELFENFQQQGTYQSMNPQLWTDYRPYLHDLDLSNTDTNFSYTAENSRGYRIEGNINEVLAWRKKIVLHNLELLGLEKKYDDFSYFHISGHTRGGEDTTKLVFESKENIFSFSNLQHFAKDSGWLFTACSCHNTYGMDFTNFTSEKKCFFDCSKPEYPISVFETVENYEEFLKMFNQNFEKSISPFFIDYLKKAAQAREATTQGYNTAATKISELEKKITFSSNLLTPRLLYFGIPGAGFLVGSKFKKYKKQMYLISAALSGIKLTYCIINSRRKTIENKKALVASQNKKDFFSKSLQENEFMDKKRKKLLEQISKRPIRSIDSV